MRQVSVNHLKLGGASTVDSNCHFGMTVDTPGMMEARLALLGWIGVGLAVGTADSSPSPIAVPRIVGDWWSVAGNPDLGEFQSEQQEPVDFAIWQAADGTWQLWSCIRNTRCGGHTRLFYRWEGRQLTEPNWTPKGVAMLASPELGEAEGGLQAPYVFREIGRYFMVYGDWNRICMATSEDGKVFHRKLNHRGQPDLFEGPYENTRDPMVTKICDVFYCYYTGHKQGAVYPSAIFCRTSTDLEHWSEPMMVSAGGMPATLGAWYGADAECPFVVEKGGMFYLFRNQFYGKGNLNTQYASANPMDFGVGNDRCRISTLPVAAPEIILNDGRWFIAALQPGLDGIRVASLDWQ